MGEGLRLIGVGSLLIAMAGTSSSPKLPVRGRARGDSGVSLARRCEFAGSFGRDLMGGGGGGRGGGGALFCDGWGVGSCRGAGGTGFSGVPGAGGVAGRVVGGVRRRVGGGGVIGRELVEEGVTCKLAWVTDLVTAFAEGAEGAAGEGAKGDKAPRVGATEPRVCIPFVLGDNTAVKGRCDL